MQTNDATIISKCLDLICSCGNWFLGDPSQSTRQDDGPRSRAVLMLILMLMLMLARCEQPLVAITVF